MICDSEPMVDIQCDSCGQTREVTLRYWKECDFRGKNSCHSCASIAVHERIKADPNGYRKARLYVPGVVYHGWLIVEETEHRQKFICRHICGFERIQFVGSLQKLVGCPICVPRVARPRRGPPVRRWCACGRLEGVNSAERGGVPECRRCIARRVKALSVDRGLFGRALQTHAVPA